MTSAAFFDNGLFWDVGVLIYVDGGLIRDFGYEAFQQLNKKKLLANLLKMY